jgi:hypothetical protein
MTILDDRPALAKLEPTALSVLRDAVARAERDLDQHQWEVYDHADAESFAGLDVENFPLPFKGQSREAIERHLSDTRQLIEHEMNDAGTALRTAMVELLSKLADDVELEMIRLNAR